MGNHLYRAMDEQAYRELAAGEGVGPSFTASKAAVLPLDDPAKIALNNSRLYNRNSPQSTPHTPSSCPTKSFSYSQEYENDFTTIPALLFASLSLWID